MWKWRRREGEAFPYERERENKKVWESIFYFIKILKRSYSALHTKRATVATQKNNWKSLHFREAVEVDILGFALKKNEFG